MGGFWFPGKKRTATAQKRQVKPTFPVLQSETFILERILTPSGLVDGGDDALHPLVTDLHVPSVPDVNPSDTHHWNADIPHATEISEQPTFLDSSNVEITDNQIFADHSVEVTIPEHELEPLPFIHSSDSTTEHPVADTHTPATDNNHLATNLVSETSTSHLDIAGTQVSHVEITDQQILADHVSDVTLTDSKVEHLPFIHSADTNTEHPVAADTHIPATDNNHLATNLVSETSTSHLDIAGTQVSHVEITDQQILADHVSDVTLTDSKVEHLPFIHSADTNTEHPVADTHTPDSDNSFLVANLEPPKQTFTSGVWTVDSTGKVSVDYLFDGGSYQGQLAIFSLDGMDKFVPGSEEFIHEVTSRALSDSNLGHVVINDVTQGARFHGTLPWEPDYNSGEYQGVKTYSMKPGDTFGVMIIPNGTVQQAFNGETWGSLRPLFSMTTANPNEAFQMGQIADVFGNGHTFVMEDLRVDGVSDHDYNDIIFQVRGATGSAVHLDDVIDSDHDWRTTDMGKALIAYAKPYDNPPVDIHPIDTHPIDTHPIDAHPTVTQGCDVPDQVVKPHVDTPEDLTPITDTKRTHFNFVRANQPLIGVIDTGFSANNPDIDYSHITLGHDYVAGDANPLLGVAEGSEHGTHVLGVIAATNDNGVGIDGINDDAPIWVSRATGSGQWANSLVEFVNYAKESGQPNAVINLSMDLTQINPDGSVTTRYEFTPPERAAIEYARQHDVLIVVAAGNDGGVMSVLGQASQEFDNIITVGSAHNVNPAIAPAEGFERVDYSSYGYGLDIMADGGTIEQPVLSTVGNGVGTMAGTSVAAAEVTGAASQVWAANPDLSYRQVIELLKITATDLSTPGWDTETGAGLLNIAAAVGLAQVTTAEEYDVRATIIPDTWSGEGKVTPSDRAAAVPMWPTVEPTSFTGRVMVTAGANVRSGPGTNFAIVGSRNFNSSVTFDGWTYGERILDTSSQPPTPDERWYRIAGTNQWIASAIIDGNAPNSTPLPPNSQPNPQPNPQPQPKPNVPINSNSPNYRDGKVNPFAYQWQGQCTWYVYGRMLETGLLPKNAKANGWFLGNAWEWKRDAERAGLPVTSTPTPGARGIVVWPPNTQGTRQYGHVAFLEEVYPDGRIRITEANWPTGSGIKERILTPAQYKGLSFVRLENATPNPTTYAPPAKPGQQRQYIVRPGDTLYAIAQRELGDGNRWREIKKADGSTFTDAEARNLQVGMSVYLPVSYQTGPGTPVKTPPPSSTPKLILPRTGGRDVYDRGASVKYAKDYADNKGNPKYHYFNYYEQCWISWLVKIGCKWVGGDCTNFVSQCLIAGGVLSLNEATEKEEGGKIYLKSNFTVVDRLVSYLLDNKIAVSYDVWKFNSYGKNDAINQLLKPGDIIAFETKNDPTSPKDHLAVFIGYETIDGNRVPMGANHSYDGIRPIPMDQVRTLIHIN